MLPCKPKRKNVPVIIYGKIPRNYESGTLFNKVNEENNITKNEI